MKKAMLSSAVGILLGSALAYADTPKRSDILLRQFDIGNYSQLNGTMPDYFQADWYNWLFHHWRPITQKDKTQFYADIAQVRAAGVKVQARVEFDANWKTFAEYFAMNGIDHRAQSVRTLEGQYQLYPAHLGMPGGQNCTGQNCASSRFTEDQLNQGLYTGQTWTFTWNGQQFTLPPYYYSTHSTHVKDLLKQQVDVLMGGSPSQTVDFQLGGNVDAIMFDSQTSSSKTLYWAGDFSPHAISAFNDYLAAEFNDLASFNQTITGHLANSQVTSFSQFNYQDYLLQLGYTDQQLMDAVYQNQTNLIPLYDLFKVFHVEAHGELLQELKTYANNFVDANGDATPDIDISSSGKLVYPVSGIEPSKVDFYSQEEQGDPQTIRLLYKTAEAQGKPMTFNQGPPDWAEMESINAVHRPRHLMAEGYANGANYVVPVKNDGFLSMPGDFEFMTDFIAGNETLFDGYRATTKVVLLHSYEAMESSKAFRVNGQMPAIFEVSEMLDDAGIQYTLLSFGSDLWATEPTAAELNNANVIITTTDIQYLSASQQALIDPNKVVHIDDIADMANLRSQVGQNGYADAGAHHQQIETLARKHSSINSRPYVMHVLNKTLDIATDSYTPLTDVTITLNDRAMFGKSIKEVFYYSVDNDATTPQCEVLPLTSGDGRRTFTMPKLHQWGVLVFKHKRNQVMSCNSYSETTIAPLPPQDLDAAIDDSNNLITNGYFVNGTTGWGTVGSDLSVTYDNVTQNNFAAVSNRNAGSSAARSTVEFEPGRSYHAEVEAQHQGVADDMRIAYLYKDANGANKFVTASTQQTSISNGWVKLAADFTIPADASWDAGKIWIKTVSSTDDIHFDRFTLVDTSPVTNLLKDYHFENNQTDSWVNAGGIISITFDSTLNSQVGHITGRSLHSSSAKQSVPGMEAGKTYRVTGKLMTVGIGNRVGVAISYRANATDTSDTFVTVGGNTKLSEGSYIDFDETFTLPATFDDSQPFKIWIKTWGTSVEDVYFDDLTLIDL